MQAVGAPRPVQSLQWQINGLQLAGLSWGQPGEKPLLALHGWLDNAASFARLAPLLVGYHVVALDLTGHGRSSRRSADAHYQIWDDLPEILGVLEALGWQQFDLVGHSRGAIISTLLASAFPERVRHLVLLDAVVPDAVPEERVPEQLRAALLDKQRLIDLPDRLFPSLEAAVASRAARGLSREAAGLIAERNLRQRTDGLAWVTDPRLRGASAVKLTQGQIKAVLNALSMPTLLLLASETTPAMREVAQAAARHIAGVSAHTVAGGHHFHMEDGVADVARRINSFLAARESPACA